VPFLSAILKLTMGY